MHGMPFYLSTLYLLCNRSYAGAKFSSATLPPEMFFELTTDGQREQLKEYWQNEDEDLRAKVAPGEIRGSNRAYVVKSFREQTEPVTLGPPQTELVFDGLPYELVEASEKIDVWALGALAFALLAGETLIPTTRNDDCASGEAMRVVYDWGLKKEVVLTRLEKIGDPAARDLVGKMLLREPSARPTIKSLLSSHSFFNQSNPDVLNKLKNHGEQLTTSSSASPRSRWRTWPAGWRVSPCPTLRASSAIGSTVSLASCLGSPARPRSGWASTPTTQR